MGSPDREGPLAWGWGSVDGYCFGAQVRRCEWLPLCDLSTAAARITRVGGCVLHPLALREAAICLWGHMAPWCLFAMLKSLSPVGLAPDSDKHPFSRNLFVPGPLETEGM